MVKMIAVNKLDELFSLLAETSELYLPIKNGEVVLYQPWQPGSLVTLDKTNSAVSPKDIFLPRDETYLQYRLCGRQLEMDSVEDVGDIIAFGIHPCDLKAIEMLDRVFIEQDPPDALYRERRNKTVVIALACDSPDPFCFCQEFGIDPLDAPGADIMAHLTDQKLIFHTRTEKGRELLLKAGNLLEEYKGAQVDKIIKTADFGLNVEGLVDNLQDRFTDPVWDELYLSCLSCGICTYVCPTCYCFDIEDYGNESAGERFRCWDSCMFGDFTQMAGGHNPRAGRKERVRQRFMHKLQYYPREFGDIACVGCGRCLRSCPVNLDIVQVIKKLGGVKDA